MAMEERVDTNKGQMKIGFIGLGIMGSRMAANLQQAGYELIIYNRTAAKAEELVKKGARLAKSPLEVSQKSEVIITMMENPQAVEAVANGENGFLNLSGANRLWIDCSTVNPSFVNMMAKKALTKGFRFLDAPVAGSKAPAASGDLVFLVGGDERDLKEVQPLFDIMGKKTIRVGEHGKGASMKIVVNMMMAQAMVAFSEGTSLGKSMGISEQALMDVVLNIPVSAPFLSAIRPRMENRDFTPNFPLKLIRKDLQMVSETAYENGVSMPSANLAKDIYTRAMSDGLGDQDFSSLFGYLNK